VEYYELENIEHILESFKHMVPIQTNIIRDGKRLIAQSPNIVPGDILHLRSGDRVPADCILFHANYMKVDGSNLTGESEAFHRQAKYEGSPAGTDPFDSPHVLFSSDIIVNGFFS
jgi:sodium/potassium-transporting ATPase subunit alpha